MTLRSAWKTGRRVPLGEREARCGAPGRVPVLEEPGVDAREVGLGVDPSGPGRARHDAAEKSEAAVLRRNGEAPRCGAALVRESEQGQQHGDREPKGPARARPPVLDEPRGGERRRNEHDEELLPDRRGGREKEPGRDRVRSAALDPQRPNGERTERHGRKRGPSSPARRHRKKRSGRATAPEGPPQRRASAEAGSAAEKQGKERHQAGGDGRCRAGGGLERGREGREKRQDHRQARVELDPVPGVGREPLARDDAAELDQGAEVGERRRRVPSGKGGAHADAQCEKGRRGEHLAGEVRSLRLGPGHRRIVSRPARGGKRGSTASPRPWRSPWEKPPAERRPGSTSRPSCPPGRCTERRPARPVSAGRPRGAWRP